MKIVVLLLTVALVFLAACAAPAESVPYTTAACAAPAESVPYTTSEELTTQYIIVTQEAIEVPLSQHAQAMLLQFEEYVVHGVIFGISQEDLRQVIGNFTIDYSGEGWFAKLGKVQHENMLITFSDDYPFDVHSLVIIKGEYLGLTIGESTREDVERLLNFGMHERDTYVRARRFTGESLPENDEKYSVSAFWNRDNVRISVYYEYGIVVAIDVSAVNLP